MKEKRRRNSPVQTDLKKKFCKKCGTYTIDKKGCKNIEHNLRR